MHTEPRPTALIAEDEPLMRERLKEKLAVVWPELDIVAEAADGDEALALFDVHRPQIAFLDIRMPGRSGLDVAAGIGGMRAMALMKIKPEVCHMNEGHSAFLGLERIRVAMQQNSMSFDEARVLAIAGSVFTTHTPVPAGNDRFPPELVDAYLAHYYERLGISREEFLALGRENPQDKNESFCMTVLGLKLSRKANAVSSLHGHVSRRMWTHLWPWRVAMPNWSR